VLDEVDTLHVVTAAEVRSRSYPTLRKPSSISTIGPLLHNSDDEKVKVNEEYVQTNSNRMGKASLPSSTYAPSLNRVDLAQPHATLRQ
jgi:hypothetical protein